MQRKTPQFLQSLHEDPDGGSDTTHTWKACHDKTLVCEGAASRDTFRPPPGLDPEAISRQAVEDEAYVVTPRPAKAACKSFFL